MKGFKFKLQSVLDTREKKLEESQLEFAKAKHQLQIEQAKFKELIKDSEQNETELSSILASGQINQTLIFIYQNYSIKLKNDILIQQKKLDEGQQKLNEKNTLMLEALKAKTMIEKLKEKALKEFKADFEKKDMLQIDEIATCRHKIKN